MDEGKKVKTEEAVKTRQWKRNCEKCRENEDTIRCSIYEVTRHMHLRNDKKEKDAGKVGEQGEMKALAMEKE